MVKIEALAVALLIPFIKKIIDVVRFIRDKKWESAAWQVAVWIAAVLAVLLAAQTDFAAKFAFDEISLETSNLLSQVFIGLLLGSAASLTQDTLKSFSTRTPPAVVTVVAAPVETATSVETATPVTSTPVAPVPASTTPVPNVPPEPPAGTPIG